MSATSERDLSQRWVDLQRLENQWRALRDQFWAGAKPEWALRTAMQEVIEAKYDWPELHSGGPIYTTVENAYGELWEEAMSANWPLTAVQLNKLYGAVRQHRSRKSSEADMIAFDLHMGTAPETAHALYAWNGRVHHGLLAYDWDVEHPNLQVASRYGTRPSVALVTVSLHSDIGGEVQSADVDYWAGFEALTAFALHPAYVRLMAEEKVPGCLLAGLRQEWQGLEVLPTVGYRVDAGLQLQGTSVTGLHVIRHFFAVPTRIALLSEYF